MLTAGLGTFVTYNPKTVAVETELQQAMSLMDRNRFRHLPVVDKERQLVGVISDLDVARALLAHRAWSAHLPPGEADRVCRVGDVLVRSPLAVDQDESPAAALRLILANGFHSLPVVSGDRLIGIVTSTDYLREMSYGEMMCTRLHAGDRMRAADMSIGATASLEEARYTMQQSSTEYLAVAHGTRPLGIVSLRDLRRAEELLSEGDPTAAGTIRQLLKTDVRVIRPEDYLSDAALIMVEHHVKALAVVDRHSQLQGLLTEDELLRALAEEFSE